ncbi:MAG: shikimate dehydrogenase [Desulfobacteraceae bacterium]
MDSNTALFALFGDPVSHSKGPLMHNHALCYTGFNGAYLAFAVKDIAKALESVKVLGIKGVSITIPHKEKVIPFVDEMDELALAAGAVNTIVNRDNRLFGYNTDTYGAVAPLRQFGPLAGKKVCIFGAGGAAKAVAAGLKKEKVVISIANRTENKGAALAEKVNGVFVSLEKAEEKEFDIVINTTPLGMVPDVDRTPVTKDFFKRGMIVMDIVYNPLKTKMLREAEERGCTIIDGVSMFVNQGAAQFALFTGLKAPVEEMRNIVLESFK